MPVARKRRTFAPDFTRLNVITNNYIFMKTKKLLLTLALLLGIVGGANSVKATKLYATYGTPAANGSWNSETSTYTWTGGSSNLMDWFTFANGELANYTSLKFSTSSYTECYRVCFMVGGNAVATITFYSAGEKYLVFSEREETRNLDLSTITSIKFGGAAGATIENPHTITVSSKPYLEKPMSLTWNDNGEAEIDLTDLTATGSFTFDDQTGELTSTGSGGSLSINFPAGGVDLTYLTGFSVTHTGSNLFSDFSIGTSSQTKGFWSSTDGRNDLSSHMTAGNVGDPSAITIWKWNSNSTSETITISSVKLKGGVIKANPSGEVAVETLERKYYEGGEWKTGTVSYSYGSGIGTPMGDGSSTQDEYIEISNYNEIRMYVSSGDVRIFVVKEDGFNTSEDGYIITKDGVKQNGQWGGIQDSDHKLVKNGDYYYITVSDIKAACGGQAKLIGVKAEYGQTVDISKVVVIEDSEFDYSISGSGSLSASTITALANASATSYDATGVTGSGVNMEATNPNALFKANSGVLANTNNVIVSGICTNFVLTDGYPFKAPDDFTATDASYDRSIAAATTTTVCLPFALTQAECDAIGTFYTLTGISDDYLQFAEVTSGGAAAKTPYLVVTPAGEAKPFAAMSSKSVVAGAALTQSGTNADFLGTLEATAVKSTGGYTYYALNNGEFVKAGSDKGFVLPAFRGYVKIADGDVPAARLGISFINDDVTGIKSVANSQEKKSGSQYFDLQGRRVSKPVKGLYVVNGKKMVIK